MMDIIVIIFFCVSPIALFLILVHDAYAMKFDEGFTLALTEKRRLHNRRIRLRNQERKSREKAYHARQLRKYYQIEGDEMRVAVLTAEADTAERRADRLKDDARLVEKLELDRKYRELTQREDS